MILYGFWRSSATWRVRIVLGLKNLPYEYRPVNLIEGAQKPEEVAFERVEALVVGQPGQLERGAEPARVTYGGQGPRASGSGVRRTPRKLSLPPSTEKDGGRPATR